MFNPSAVFLHLWLMFIAITTFITFGFVPAIFVAVMSMFAVLIS